MLPSYRLVASHMEPTEPLSFVGSSKVALPIVLASKQLAQAMEKAVPTSPHGSSLKFLSKIPLPHSLSDFSPLCAAKGSIFF